MTGVSFYIENVYDDDGNKTGEINVSADISVCPKYITDYGEKYLLFSECEVKALNDKYSQAVSNSGYSHPDYNNFLIRKTDGAIFKIEQSNIDKFPTLNAFRYSSSRYKLQYNNSGDLYMTGRSGGVSKIKLENDKLLLQELSLSEDSYYLLLDKYDNFYCSPVFVFPMGMRLYFANGSVMEVNPLSESSGSVMLINKELYCMAFKVNPDPAAVNQDKTTVNLYKLPTQLPANPLDMDFELVATVTLHGDYRLSVAEAHESETQVVCGSVVYDKATKTLSTRIFPNEFQNKIYNQEGVAYSMQNKSTIAKYNVFDLTTETIECDRSSVPLFITNRTDETSTEYIEYGIKNSNSAPIRVHTELSTGRVTVYEDPDNRTITELVKVS